MAIYKLGDIANIKIGKTPSTKNNKYWYNGEISWYNGENLSKNSHNCKKITRYAVENNNQPLTTNNSLLLSMVRYIEPLIPLVNASFNQGVACIEPYRILEREYLYYWLENNKKMIKENLTSGSTFPSINSSDIKSIQLDLPSLKQQQEIIDIIKPNEELYLKYSNTIRINDVDNCKKDMSDLIDIIKPIEKSLSKLSKLQKNIESLEKAIIEQSKPTRLLFNYHKGGLAGDEGATMFLNVASANGNPNRYVNNEPNVFIGDVTLSLDGNCGLVNNTIEGYNGYLYKVTAENIPSWQIFYSLKTEDSQNIIKLNETGTTIKHASGAKKELRVHKFEDNKLLSTLFEARIHVYKMRTDLELKLQHTIKLLIK
ncbi:MAG: restriction endonuclease subunit S [Mycoplasmatales bacterium]